MANRNITSPLYEKCETSGEFPKLGYNSKINHIWITDVDLDEQTYQGMVALESDNLKEEHLSGGANIPWDSKPCDHACIKVRKGGVVYGVEVFPKDVHLVTEEYHFLANQINDKRVRRAIAEAILELADECEYDYPTLSEL